MPNVPLQYNGDRLSNRNNLILIYMTTEQENAIRENRRRRIESWRMQDFVVGYEIKCEDGDTCEICRTLAGKYPKSFSWGGWHDGCRCNVSPILSDKETERENFRRELEHIKLGIPFFPATDPNEVRRIPFEVCWYAFEHMGEWESKQEFPKWYLDNKQSIDNVISNFEL